MTLEHLDTIIVFVVIITGVSLLITTLARMVSALLIQVLHMLPSRRRPRKPDEPVIPVG